MLQCLAQVKQLGRKGNLTAPKPLFQAKRAYSTANREKIVFGIDYGSNLAKVAVYDRKSARPSLLLNREDGNVPYWHTAVAYDKLTKKLVAGKKAKAIAREDPGAAAIKVKKLLGTKPGHRQYEEWISENNPQAVFVEPKSEWGQEEQDLVWDLDKANKVVVALNSTNSKTFSATELAATTFESMRRVMQEYQAEHGGYGKFLPEAYLVVPPDFDEAQRSSIVLAARRAGIQVLKLIEEPIAALYGVRRLENFGWYSVTDFGDTCKHYVIRVFDGEPDVYEASYTEIPNLLPKAERSFYEYLANELPATKHIRPWKNQLVKLFDAARDHLIDHPEYVIPDDFSWMKSTLPHISREARALSSFYSLRNAGAEQVLLDAVSKTLPPSSLTHSVLIGGNSLAYPEISNVVERAFGTRLADTITNPTGTLALGAAMKAAEDQGFVQSILRGRDASSFGHPILSSSYVDTIHHHLHLSKHHVPFPSTLNFSTIAAYDKFEPLLPAFQEEQLLPENCDIPYPALSYGLLRDPYSGELEHWARISVQVPHPPPKLATLEERAIEKPPIIPKEMIVEDPTPEWLLKEMLLAPEPSLEDVQPDLSLCFALNLTASPLFDTARNIKYRTDLTEEEKIKHFQSSSTSVSNTFSDFLQANPDRESYRLASHIPTAGLKQVYEENLLDILEMMQHQKDSHSGYYRVQNRAHAMLQTILMQLRPNDHHAVIATGGMAPTPLLASSSSPPRMGSAMRLSDFQQVKSSNPTSVLQTVATTDCTGRASSKYADAISMAHEMMLEHMEKLKEDAEAAIKHDLKVMEDAILQVQGDSETVKALPPHILTDDLDDIPKLHDGGQEDPADWMYPGISPGLMHDYYMMYRMLQYELTEAGKKDIKESIAALPAEERPDSKGIQESIEQLAASVRSANEDTLLENRLEALSGIRFLTELMERMDARKKLKRLLGRQYRAVIIVDSPPDASHLKDLETALQRAARDGVSVTFLSIEGSPFDGPFLQMIARVKGAKTLRLYKKYLWNTQFLESFGQDAPNAWHQAFNEPSVRNLALKVDFPGYTIDKVYGGWMTNDEKARLEMQKTTSTLRFKIGSLAPSFDIIPGPTPPTADPIAMLVKLKPKPGANDAKRATDPDWFYDPNTPTSATQLTVGARVKPSVHTPVSFDITWNNREGSKLNRVHTLRLTDFNAPPEYFDEPGLPRLVRVAKFVEVMRKVLHQPFQSKLSMFDSDTPMLEVDNASTGIQFVPQKQENTLVRVYDEAKQSVIRIANERLLDLHNDGPIPKEYHELVKLTAHLLDWNAARHHGPSFMTTHSSTDIISRLMRSYMEASNISPVTMYARWRATLNSTFDSAIIARLEDPNLEPSNSSLANAPVLATLMGQKKQLYIPQPEHIPKFHGQLATPQERDPSLDIRNSYINANRMNSLEIFPRSEMTPIHPVDLWSWNHFSQPEGSWDIILSYIEPEHRSPDSTFYVPPGFDTRGTIKALVGPHWNDWEKLIDKHERLQEWQAAHPLATIGSDFLGKKDNMLVSLWKHANSDEKLFVELLDMMARNVEKDEALYVKNAVLGPQLLPLTVLRRYYMKHVAPHQSEEEIAKAKRIFKRMQRRHEKSEARSQWESDQFDQWYQMLQTERSYPSTLAGYAIHLIEKVQQEDLDQANKNWAQQELEALEQRVIDSDAVLLKHLMQNRDVLNAVSLIGKQEGATDADILAELEKHVPRSFLDEALSTAQRVTVTNRGFHPTILDDARRLGSEEEAWAAEAAYVGEAARVAAETKPLSEMEQRAAKNREALYARLPQLIPAYETTFPESTRPGWLDTHLPLEVELGNVPIDWDARFERLKRKARAVTRARVIREDENKYEVRNRLREHVTKVAQSRVDHRLFLMYVGKQEAELQLQMSDLPYSDPEEYNRRMAQLSLQLSPSDYAILVWAEYRRVAMSTMREWEHSVTEGMDALLPMFPRNINRKLVDILEQRRIISNSTAEKHRDPIKYWFGSADLIGEDFVDERINIEGRPMSIEDTTLRYIYNQQVAADQKKQATASGSSEVLVDPGESDFVVSSGESAAEVLQDLNATTPQEMSSELNEESKLSPSAEEGVSTELGEEGNNTTSEASLPQEGLEQATEEAASEPQEVLAAPKPIYTEFERITKDPYTREDFGSDLEWHIYKTQTANQPFIQDPEKLQQKRDEVSFDIVDFLNPDGSIDWDHVKTRRMQYPQTPSKRIATVEGNSTYDNTDNTGREMTDSDIDERAVTKAEVEATSQLDFQDSKDVVQASLMMDSMRYRDALEERKKEAAAAEAAKYDAFKVVKDEGYNPLRDGWDSGKYERAMHAAYDLYRRKVVDLEREEVIKTQELNREWESERIRAQIEYTMMMPGQEQRGYAESWVKEDQIQREASYSPWMNVRNLTHPHGWDYWKDQETRAYRGIEDHETSTVYMKLFGFEIPVGLTTYSETRPIDFHLRILDNLKRRFSPRPTHVFEPNDEPMFYSKSAPRRIAPSEDPALAREKTILSNLSQFALHRYLQAVRKAYEKFYGLSRSRSSTKTSAEHELEYQKLQQLNSSIGPVERIVQPSQTEKTTIALTTEEERAAEAARLVRAALNMETSEAPSSNSVAPSPIQNSLESLQGRTPGSLDARFPQTWAERWRWAKQVALDNIIRDHALAREQENFQSWLEVQREALKKRSLDGDSSSPPAPIVRYPQYLDLNAPGGGLFGIPGTSVSSILAQIANEAHERRQKAAEILQSELQKAYRDWVADSKKVKDALEDLSSVYEPLFRRRLKRATVPIIPDNVEDMAMPQMAYDEASLGDMECQIDLELLDQVKREDTIPGVHPDFWSLTDTKSRRAQARLNKLLVRGSPKAIEAWDAKMDEIHARKWKLADQINKRQEELHRKHMKNEARSVFGPYVMDDLEHTAFWDKRTMALYDGLASLDERVKKPETDWERDWINLGHVQDLSTAHHPMSYTRLARFVEESLKAQRREAGLPEDEEAASEHDHGHGHGH
jgi:hypothetical protein